MSGYTGDIIARRGVADEGVSFVQQRFSSDENRSPSRTLTWWIGFLPSRLTLSSPHSSYAASTTSVSVRDRKRCPAASNSFRSSRKW